jgi:hypothetical protein
VAVLGLVSIAPLSHQMTDRRQISLALFRERGNPIPE